MLGCFWVVFFIYFRVVFLMVFLVTLGTPGATLATQGVTFEAQGSQNWIPPMIVFRCGTILDLQGDIWGAIWGHFGVFLDSFFGIFSR